MELGEADYRLIQARPWYGNIRELRNFCERLAVLYQPGSSVSELVAHLLSSVSSIPCTPPAEQAPSGKPVSAAEDHAALLALLEECRGNKTLAADRLGISRVTLWRMLKRYEEAQANEKP